MAETFVILLLVLVIIAVASFIFKNDYSKMAPTIFVAAGVGAIASGMGLRIRELVEGPFGYLDIALTVMMGMIFVMMLMHKGIFQFYFNKIIAKKRNSFIQALLLILFIALPGIFTGSATACLLTTGVIAGGYLVKKGVQKNKVVEFIAVSSFLGMILPPICLPAMIIVVSRSGSYPASFEGYALPLLVAAIPALLAYAKCSSKWIGDLTVENIKEVKQSGLCSIPIIVVAILLFSHNFLYRLIPFLGYPLIFAICVLLVLIVPGKKINILESAGKGINIIAPVVALTFVVGSALEIFTLVGISGKLATIFYSTNAVALTIGSMIIIILSGVIVGGSFAYVVGVLCSYVIGATMYMGNELLLTATSLALCLALFLPLRGGFLSIVADFLGVKEIDTKKLISESIIPLGLVLAIGLIYALAYNKLLFLII